jgi:hypothetical protein
MNMRKITWITVCLLGLGGSLASCKKDDPTPEPVVASNQLRVKVQPYFGAELLHLDSTYVSNEGYLVQFTDLKFYATEWKNGSVTLTDAALFNYRQNGTDFIEAEKSPLDFEEIHGYLGVGANNHADPSAFPNESPLNISNTDGMHWDWNPGYIFIAVEARADTLPDPNENFDQIIVLHVGTDAFLQTLDFTNISWTNVGEKIYEATLKLDLQVFLANGPQTIDLKEEYITHSAAGQEVLSLKAIQNFKAALSWLP